MRIGVEGYLSQLKLILCLGKSIHEILLSTKCINIKLFENILSFHKFSVIVPIFFQGKTASFLPLMGYIITKEAKL